MSHSSPKERFSDRVDNYIRYRPGYPAEIIGYLAETAGMKTSSNVADIGSGTGISSEMLLRLGMRVTGVEPNHFMREAAEKLLAGYPKFRSVDGSADATGLPDQSVDLIIAAQAFHWFNSPETRREFTRILRIGGHIALIWNVRKFDSTPFLKEYEQLLLTYGTDYAEVRHENIDTAALRNFFVGPYTGAAFPHSQSFNYTSLKGRLLSSSYAPQLGHPMHDPMIAELRRIYDLYQENDSVVFEYATEVYVGR